MFTQCSKCETVFRLSAQMLRAAAGQVRCGRCGEVFNALTRLAEDPTAFVRGDSPRDMEARADVILEFPPALDLSGELALEDDDEDAVPPGMARLHFLDPLPDALGEDIGGTDIGVEESARSLEFTLPPGDLDRVFFVDSRPNLLRQLIDDAELPPHPESRTHPAPADLQLPEAYEPMEDAAPRFVIAPVPAEFEWRELSRRDPVRRDPERRAPPHPAAADSTPDATAAHDAAATPVAPPPQPRTGSATPQRSQSPAGAAARPPSPGLDVADEVRQAMLAAYKKPLPSLVAPAAPGLPFRAWLGAAIALGLVLAAQVVLGNRDWLAAHSAGAGVTSLFSLVGVPVSPQANLSVYQLRQWGVSGDPGVPGTLRVRASILNTAAQLEPYPLLRITLANRFGAHIGARAFEPAEYLATPATRLLSPGERLEATLDILDPGKDAEGFEIDVCLRDSHQRLYCAGDVAAPR